MREKKLHLIHTNGRRSEMLSEMLSTLEIKTRKRSYCMQRASILGLKFCPLNPEKKERSLLPLDESKRGGKLDA